MLYVMRENATYSTRNRVAQRIYSASHRVLRLNLGPDLCTLHIKQASTALPTPREATEMLEKWVRELSIKGLKKSGGPCDEFLCFDTTMQLADKAGLGEEWSWVRAKNVAAFTAQVPRGGVPPP